MDKRVVLKLGENNLGRGFPVTLSIGSAGMMPSLMVTGDLPADPDLYQLYATWATAYRQLGLQIQSDLGNQIERGITDVETCRNNARVLSDRLNRWLQTSSFRPIRDALMTELTPSDDIQIVLQTDNVWLRRLPWHLWELNQAFPSLEISLSAQSRVITLPPLRPKTQVRVLSVLSSSKAIDVETAQRLLNYLPTSDIHFLVEPTLTALHQAFASHDWDIVCFSGQSPALVAGEAGRIYLNASDSLSINELCSALEPLVQRGLQILVMNAWDGMAIAPPLEQLGIPQLVIMREPAPTLAAHHFFTEFLREFAAGASFYLAVRKARQALDRLDAEFPCVSWLPIICQHLNATSFTWQSWEQDASMTLPPLPDVVSGEVSSEPIHATESLASRSWQSRPTEPIQMNPTVAPANRQNSWVPKISPRSPSRTLHPQSTSLINNRYQIRKVLGRGGFGQTYLAIDTHRFDEPCVLKQFIPASRSEAGLKKARELFQREAKVLYQIDHPQIPKFLAWFTHEDDLFIVQEYIDGQSYLSLLRDRQQQGRTFSEREVIRLLRELVPVLSYIHSIGIVHRDISPANIMFSNAKQKPMLIDFGVVKEVVNQILSGQYSTFAHPPKATLVGKPGYSPPEQIQLGDCFPCSDFYALGMTAIVLLTGQDVRVSRRQWRELSAVRESFANVIERMLAERPRERYQTAEAILADLNQLSAPLGRPIPPPPLHRQNWPSIPRSNSQSVAPRSHPLIEPDRSARGSGSNVNVEDLSAAFLEQCQHILAEYIGPVASFAIDDLIAQSPNLDCQEFVAQLAAEIPEPVDAYAFRQQMQSLIRGSLLEKTEQHVQPRQNAPLQSDLARSYTRNDGNGGSVLGESPIQASSLSQEFIARCRYELALCIGPMANFIVDDVLSLLPHLSEDQFIEAIAAELPNEASANSFRQRFR